LQETKYHLTNHIYLNGVYAPVGDENTGVLLEVEEGALPKDLDGLFVRNGPNPIPSQIAKRYHWFDGHGMLHNVRIEPLPQPSATYSNSYIPTPRYEIEKKLGEEVFSHVGEFTGVTGILKALLVNSGIPKAYGLTTLTSGQANTHTVMYNNKFLCCHEASLPFEVQLDNDGRIVQAVGFEEFNGVLDYPMSAHPKKDPVTGNFLFHGYAGDATLVKRYGPIKVGEYDTQRHQMLYYIGVRPDDEHTSFAHDMLFTKNWMVVYDSSVHFDTSKILEANTSFFNYNAAVTLRIALIPRLGSKNGNETALSSNDVIWIDAGTSHVMIHPLAAWEEEDGTVVLWSPIGDYFDGNIDSGLNVYHMAEFRMNPRTGRLLSKTMIDTTYNVEFPRVRDDCLGHFCRFGYAGIMDPTLGGDGLFSGFTVWDMEKRTLHKAVLYRKGDIGGEPVVIPKPGRTESNAVYLGTFVHNTNDNQSYFVLYDGEGDNSLVTRLKVPHRVPIGFHGQWVSGDELRAHVNYHATKFHQETPVVV
jgi:carotenoid cleavage dioxygenase